MMNLIYVTGNYGKFISVKEHFETNGISISFLKNDFDEPEINDIKIISESKAKTAYELLHQPCFVADTGFYIDYYPDHPGYPGAFVKRSGVSSNIEKLLEIMAHETRRTCRFIDCLTFYDGNDFYSFFGISEGSLAYEICGDSLKKAKSNLWKIFIPKNCSKTLAQMTDEERANRPDGHTSATEEFIVWYQSVYMKQKVKKKTSLI